MKITATRARLLFSSIFATFSFSMALVPQVWSLQTAEIPATPGAISNSDSSTGSVSMAAVPDSLTKPQKNWLRILESPAPSIDEEIMTCEALIDKLRALGLPMVVDRSALEDQISLDEPLQLLFPDGDLLDRLENTLSQKNALIALDSGALRLISRDDAEDQRHLTLIAYDLTGTPDLEALLESCRSIDPQQNFLDGSNMTVLKINGRFVLTLNAPFDFHMKLRRLFQAIAVHTGPFVEGAKIQGVSRTIPVAGRMPRATISTPGQQFGSTPVRLPDRKQKAGINLSKDGSNFSGMGGGMFRFGDKATR